MSSWPPSSRRLAPSVTPSASRVAPHVESGTGGAAEPPAAGPEQADQRILDATLAVLARNGVAGVSVRAVATEAGVARGLAGYYFQNKRGLIAAALRRIGEQDLELVLPAGDSADPAEHLRRSLRRAVDTAYLDPDYLSLRLQLWSLAGVDEKYAVINRNAQRRYLAGLADLISAARPDLSRADVERRATDILIVQNGVWLTAVLIDDADAVDRAIARCEEFAFG